MHDRVVFLRRITLDEARTRLFAIPNLKFLVAVSIEEDDPVLNEVPAGYGIVIDISKGSDEDVAKAIALILNEFGDDAITDLDARGW
jgi:spore coat polysaccharide biosynthesis protein SpsF (cytidylyltransferase family)